jgi:hypothetical protein
MGFHLPVEHGRSTGEARGKARVLPPGLLHRRPDSKNHRRARSEVDPGNWTGS